MPPPERKPSPQAIRAQERRDAKLADMADQVKDGSLVIRQMTAAERKELESTRKPRPVKARKTGR